MPSSSSPPSLKPERPSPRLPIDSCQGMLAKLKWDQQQFEGGWDEYKTFNFVITAHHLFTDWIDSAGTRVQKNKRKSLPDQAKLIFSAWRDITNASKHWTLNSDSKKKQVVTEVTKPRIGDWHAYFITGPVIYVSIGAARPGLPQLANVTVRTLDWIINAEESTFPEALLNDLDAVLEPIGPEEF